MKPRGQIATLTVLAGAFLVLATGAGATEQDGDGVAYLGTGFTGQPFALGGDVVLETDGDWNCLRDYGAPETPGWIAWHHGGASGGFWREVLWEDGLLAVLRDGFNAGVEFLDVNDPAAPVSLGSIGGTVYSAGLLRDRLLYLTRDNLIIVYDLTVPASPAFRFATTLPDQSGRRSFCASDHLIGFIESDTDVHLLDATDRTAIQDLGTFTPAADRVDALAASAGALHALLATETTPEVYRIELTTFDITDPTAPVETDRRLLVEGLGARGLQLERRDQLLLASENQAATHAFDVTTPTLPAPGFTLPVPAERLVMTATRVLTFAGEELQVHTRTGASETPILLSVRHVLPSLRRVSGDGPVLLAQPEKDHSILVGVDVTNPANPHLIAEFETGLDGDFVHDGGVAVMIDDDDIQVIEVGDPAAPVLRGNLRLTSRVSGPSAVIAPGILAMETNLPAAVALVDLRDLDSPVEAAHIDGADVPLAVGSGVLLVAADDQVTIHDIRDPHHPVDLGSLSLAGTPLAAAIAGPRAYCLTGSAPGFVLHVVDIADPSAATVITTQELDEPGSLEVHGQRLHVVSSGGVRILDIAQVGPPPVSAWLAPAFPPINRVGTHDDLVITGRYLTVTRDLTWIPVTVEAPPRPRSGQLISIHPNPFNPRTTVTFELATPQHATVAVHDLRGSRLTTLASRHFTAGRHVLPFTATPPDGPLPSGLYLIRLTTPHGHSTLPATLIK